MRSLAHSVESELFNVAEDMAAVTEDMDHIFKLPPRMQHRYFAFSTIEAMSISDHINAESGNFNRCMPGFDTYG